jgi:hypothetical protein
MRTSQPRRGAGFVLLLAVVLLAILTALGVAAVRVAARDRESAGNKSRFDRGIACARAAQAKIWSEVAAFGTGYLVGSQPVTAITLPDGTQLAAPAHWDTATDGSVSIQSVTLAIAGGAGGAQLPAVQEMSNSGGSTIGSDQVLRVVARCRDSANRTFEIELGVRFAL